MRKAFAALLGTASLLTIGLGATAAGASPNPSVCKASNVSVTFLGKTGTVNEGYNPQHPSVPNTATKYRLLVTNKGAPCTLHLTDPSISIYTPAYFTSVLGAKSNAEQGLLVKGDADWFTLLVQSPNNYATTSVSYVRGHYVCGHYVDEVWVPGYYLSGYNVVSANNPPTYQTVHLNVSLPGVTGPPQVVFTGWGNAITFAEVAGSFSTGPLNG